MAFEPLGWRPLAFSEIEAFPRAVLQHHYPDTPLHGDFTVLKDEPWIVDADMLCGGTPCQAFSVAGNRQSLADDRGNLTLQFVLLADAIDHLRSTAGREPAWILWENVPGVLSTNDNAFGAFLGGLVGRTAAIPEPEGGWTGAGVVDGPTRCAAWRVLDAQHFGLAQRRKRVFVLAKGGAGRWAAADALLPIIEGSRWHPAPSRGKGERSAEDACSGAGSNRIEGVDYENNGVEAGEPMGPLMKGSPTGGGRPLPVVAFAQNTRDEVRYQGDGDICGTLAAEPGMKQTTYIAFDPAQDTSPTNRSNPQPGDPCHTLHRNEPPMLIRMREGKECGGKGPLVSEDQSLTLATANDQVLAVRNGGRDSDMREGRNGTTMQADIMFTLQAQQQHSVAYPIQECNVSRANLNGTGTGIGEEGGPMFTLQAAQPHGVCASISLRTRDGVVSAELGEPGIANALRGSDGGRAGEGAGAVLNGMQVRRLTPVECERLQGFPDGYTNIPWRGKPESPDGSRYKALGNSWAVPVVRYIGERIKAVAP